MYNKVIGTKCFFLLSCVKLVEIYECSQVYVCVCVLPSLSLLHPSPNALRVVYYGQKPSLFSYDLSFLSLSIHHHFLLLLIC